MVYTLGEDLSGILFITYAALCFRQYDKSHKTTMAEPGRQTRATAAAERSFVWYVVQRLSVQLGCRQLKQICSRFREHDH